MKELLAAASARVETPGAYPARSLSELLDESSARHMHLCPRQVLGARMGLFGSQLLGIAISGNEKRLLVIVETDGCFADGVSVATSCTVGARTLRVIDHGKVAVVFVDTKSDRAVCDACGEEISNERETIQAGRVLCRACAGHQCWQLL